ncbi:MAG: hypothetical protein EAZ35_08330 [Sphingobacteriia bacterium]|jgi:hypothetical protein|nr:MAG: hypothetical protein EAZ41_05690 [Sphingobacteriia bacterium]TAG30177.1 MAG: hypothetical protein EAZ35_08330 [Sphingobacteriia bacterium]
MYKILFLLTAAFTLVLACKSPKKIQETPVLQGIIGVVNKSMGNQMPRIGQPPSIPQPFPTTVFFYEPTNTSQVNQIGNSPLYRAIYTKLIATVQTDSVGVFTAKLPVGNYSVFVQVDKQFFANSFDIRNNISLVMVEAGKITDVKITVNNAASY